MPAAVGSTSHFIGFLGAKGGVGTTTLAINTASVLLSGEHEAILVDLQPITSALITLNLAAPALPANMTNGNGGVLADANALQGFMVQHSNGLRVLSLPSPWHYNDALLPAEQLDALFRTITTLAPFVLVDIGCGLTPLTRRALAFIDRLIACGTLPEMLDEAERFIRRNTRTAMKVVGFESTQVTEYPYDAIREALVNAMAHRDYDHSSGIQVNVFDDRLEVMSPGKALIPLSELEGSHVTRNETLCRRFRDIGEMEQFGTGITKMKRLMREHGLEEPVFEERGTFFKTTFPGPGDQILGLVPRAGVTNLRALGLNERQIEALRLMVNEGIEFTNQNYREHFGVVKKTVVRDLEKLIEHGLVRRVGRGRAIKYVAVGLMP